MNSIVEGFTKAFSLILHLDAEPFGIISLSLKISCLALLIATLFEVPLGAVGMAGSRRDGWPAGDRNTGRKDIYC